MDNSFYIYNKISENRRGSPTKSRWIGMEWPINIFFILRAYCNKMLRHKTENIRGSQVLEKYIKLNITDFW